VRYLQRAQMLPPSEFPAWVLHCDEFLLTMASVAQTLGEFKVDVTHVIVEAGVLECSNCGFILPKLRGYAIATGDYAGQVVALDTLELAEDPLEVVP
jgi:hypothetical protein